VGMATAVVKDNSPDSMTKGKKIALPVTIIETPNMKIFSVRFYKNGKVMKDVVVSNEPILKRIVKVPKEIKPLESQAPKEFDDIRLVVYSIVKSSGIKKTPDIIEFAIHAPNKLEFAKSMISREITIKDFIHSGLVDIRGLTKGHGLTGPVKRFGITLKQHKTEKGVRRPGSLSPWHPARVTFRTPMAGQYGCFSRVHYNYNVLSSSSISEKDINPKQGFMHYGKIKSSYLLVKGSVQGPAKHQLLLTFSFRPTKHTSKKKYELQEVFA